VTGLHWDLGGAGCVPIEQSMNALYPVPGCRVEQVTPDSPAHLRILARGLGHAQPCPVCGQVSRSVHSCYFRRPADLPSLGQVVSIGLCVRRFYCHNTAYRRCTFAERLPDLVSPFARRTRRLAKAQGQTGVALGGEAGARLLSRLSMPTSADTVLRLVRQMPLPDPDPPHVIGVDDWAKNKGRRYGTIVVDLARHRVVDLLPDRTATTLADWLRRRAGIEVVARDRSTEYASGIAMGAPAAVQVADRWHLLANLRQAVERWLASVHAHLRQLPAIPNPVGPRPGSRSGPFPRSAADEQVRLDSEVRRRVLYDEVQRRCAAGESLSGIARAMNLARGTTRSYAQAADFPERAARRPRPSLIDPYLSYLQARVAEGCVDAAALWRDLRAQGYTGTAKQIRRWLSERRTAPARTAPHRWCGRIPVHTAPSSRLPATLPAPRQLAWLLVQPPSALIPLDAASVARIEQDADAGIVMKLARKFTTLVRQRGAWIRCIGAVTPPSFAIRQCGHSSGVPTPTCG
jgi:transposase